MKDYKDFLKILEEHPAFSEQRMIIGSKGFSIPTFDDPQILEITPENIEILSSKGIRCSGNSLNVNRIIIEKNMEKIDLNLTFSSQGGNILCIENKSRIKGTITFSGRDHIFVCGGESQNAVNFHVVYRTNECGVFIGRGGSANSVNYWIEGPNRSICVGDDFLMSWGIWVRAADSHAIIDLNERSVVNKPESVVIGPHVWLGQDTTIMSGVGIGAGSIVGAKAVVTRSIPRTSVAAGIPAKVLRTGVSWSRQGHPSLEEINQVVDSDILEYTPSLER